MKSMLLILMSLSLNVYAENAEEIREHAITIAKQRYDFVRKNYEEYITEKRTDNPTSYYWSVGYLDACDMFFSLLSENNRDQYIPID